ncbi:1,2-dihydroxy-3-keto-5-methylthiopentene dioxygenase [Bacidia gigantensis]|uniref:1,2-dihydroxy-3-keto-5-methylthiopentene dioxygenase n=1 Tax=Bacidia gigantensis TaxID=2732470 RepID=UPI001D04310D|nr:1,2-dihydroxy-3-keto-5-methylthiopentene dioxygenase [Bacidia gigantensis]KAG8531055.1 1,2-dihydroxy-3-keto-5-methylthiopentene dioxygenase [Bacidia gigantensis]
MKAYWFDNREGDQREEHDSGTPLPPSYLSNLGVLYHHCPTVSQVDEIAKERSYKNRDEITVSKASMGDVYEEKVRMFFNEHLHEDEEIRYILDGEGFFDVRSYVDGDRWVDGWMELMNTQYIKAMRLFKDEPKWTPLNRAPELEENPHRKTYLQDRSAEAGMMT